MANPKGRTHVLYAVPKLVAPLAFAKSQKSKSMANLHGDEEETQIERGFEFALRTEDGKFFDVCVESLEMRDTWVQACAPAPARTRGAHAATAPTV